MSTRVGKFIFDFDVEEMSIEKLDALRGICEFTIKKKKAEAIAKEFHSLNLRAHAEGFDLCFVNPDDSDDKYVLNQYNFEVKERVPNEY